MNWFKFPRISSLTFKRSLLVVMLIPASLFILIKNTLYFSISFLKERGKSYLPVSAFVWHLDLPRASAPLLDFWLFLLRCCSWQIIHFCENIIFRKGESDWEKGQGGMYDWLIMNSAAVLFVVRNSFLRDTLQAQGPFSKVLSLVPLQRACPRPMTSENILISYSWRSRGGPLTVPRAAVSWVAA